MCILHILVGANLKILRAYNLRLTVCEGNYAASNVGEPLQVLAPLLMMIVTIVISPGPRLLPVIPFHVIRITIIGKDGRVRLTKAWAITL